MATFTPKFPESRIVFGKVQGGAIWAAQSKNGLAYGSGQLDLTALKKAIADGSIVVKKNATGNEVVRFAVFKATRKLDKSATGGL